MNLDYLKDNLKFRKEALPTALIGIAVLCGVLILVKGPRVWSGRPSRRVRRIPKWWKANWPDRGRLQTI
ncbi:MAG: hypothetical protein ACYTAO_02840 [Planctomycetota bacterium]